MEIVRDHHARSPVLGVDPELVLVLELNRPLHPEDVARNGLRVLELSSGRSLVAFSDEPELATFRGRLEAYARGPRPARTPGGEDGSAAHEGFFDAVDVMRPLADSDVLAPALDALLSSSTAPWARLRLDAQCWCPEDEREAARRHREVGSAVAAAGGRVLDSSLRHRAGLSVHRVELSAARVRELARVDRVRWLDLLPQPRLTQMAVRHAGPDDLPLVIAPRPDAPVAGVLDSGVRSSHPLLAPAILGTEYVGPGLGSDGDEHGHGTMVASLALHGALEEAVAERRPLQPAGRLLSVRVLDADNQFPDGRLWESHLLEAMRVAVDGGARVLNLSLGDPRRPYVPPRPTPLAALIDTFVREHDVVVVVSAGNYPPSAYSPDALVSGDYVLQLLHELDTGLLDPASAALALTAGALCPDLGSGARPARERVDLAEVGRPGRASPHSCVGPGAMGMVKPELSAPGGSLAVDTLTGRVVLVEPSACVLAAGGERPEHLLALGSGTSLAAPLLSHAALRVLGRYPSLSANAVRPRNGGSPVMDGCRQRVQRHQTTTGPCCSRSPGWS